MQRTADLRYVGPGLRGARPGGRRRARRAPPPSRSRGLPRRAPPALRLRLRRRPAPGRRVGQPPGQRDRADPASRHASSCAAEDGGTDRAVTGSPPRLLRRLGGRRPRTTRLDLAPGDVVDRPGRSSRSSARPSRPPRLRRHRRRLRQPAAHEGVGARADDHARRSSADPVLVEIVAGTLAAIEKEVETSIGRTSRSPMIRDAHDFRAGIHDRQLRKLTGRSYSALVHPVVRDYPIETMNVGRRLLPQRRLPLRRRHRPPARPVRHRAGVRGRGTASPRSSRSSRRSATTTTSAARCPARCRRRRPACTRRA